MKRKKKTKKEKNINTEESEKNTTNQSIIRMD